MKRLGIFVAAMLVLIQFEAISSYGEGDPIGYSQSEPLGYCAPLNSDVLVRYVGSQNSDIAIIMPIGADIREQHMRVSAFGYLNDDNWTSIEPDIVWDYDSLDTSTSGKKIMPGKILLPLGYSYPDGDLAVEQCVVVYDPDQSGVETLLGAAATTSQIIPYGEGADALAAFWENFHINKVGREGLDEFLDRFAMNTGSYQLDEIYYFNYPSRWDASLVDMNKVGTYYPFSTPPSYFALSDVAQQDMAVHVIDPNEVDLAGWKLYAFGGSFKIEWFKEIEDPELWISVNGGEWKKEFWDKDQFWESSDQFRHSFNDAWEENATALSIFEGRFETGNTYEFEVRYENGGRSVNTFIMDLTDGRHKQYGNGGGDRGGGDRPEPTPGSGGETSQPDPGGETSQPDPGGETSQPDPGGETSQPDPGGETSQPDSGGETLTPAGGTGGGTSSGGSGQRDRDSYTTVQSPPPTAPAVVEELNIEAENALKPSGAAGTHLQPISGEYGYGTAPASPQTEQSVPSTPQSPPKLEDKPTQPQPEAPVPMSDSPINGSVSIAVVGALSTAGVAVFWKLLGKRLVKPR